MSFKRTLNIKQKKIPKRKLDTELGAIITLSSKVKIVNILKSENINTVRDLLSHKENLRLISGISTGTLNHLSEKLTEHLGFEVTYV